MDIQTVIRSCYPEWQGVPELSVEFQKLMDAGVPITKEITLKVMRVIYDRAENSPADHAGFPLDGCRRAIERVEREIGEDLSLEVN